MALQKIFDRLLEFPVFQGLGKIDLEEMVAQTKFDFHKFPSGKMIVREGDKCNRLFFLLSGKIETCRESDDHGYCIYEERSAPLLLQSEALFGYSQRFAQTVTAATEVGIMTVDEDEVLKFLERYHVVRLNVVNRLATNIQQLQRLAWKHQSEDLSQRIIDFVAMRCKVPTGKKVVKIKMTRLAHELNDNRLNVSIALNELADAGLIELRRGSFVIPAMEFLINRYSIK